MVKMNPTFSQIKYDTLVEESEETCWTDATQM